MTIKTIVIEGIDLVRVARLLRRQPRAGSRCIRTGLDGIQIFVRQHRSILSSWLRSAELRRLFGFAGSA